MTERRKLGTILRALGLIDKKQLEELYINITCKK